MMIYAALSVIAIVSGASILGSIYGWKIGLAIGLIAWGLKQVDKP